MVGAWGDATLLTLEKGSFELEDTIGQIRTGQQRLAPVTVVKAGKIYNS